MPERSSTSRTWRWIVSRIACVELVGRRSGDVEQERIVGQFAGDGRNPEHAPRLVRQAGEPSEEDVAERGRQARRVAIGAAGCDQLLGEEGVALGPGVDPPDDRLLRDAPEDGRQHLALLVHVERLELDPGHVRETGQLGEPDQERVAAREVVRTERADNDHATATERADEEHEQVAGGGVAPVKVLQDHDQRPLGGNAVDQRERQLEESVRVGRRAERGRSRGCGSGDRRGDRPGFRVLVRREVPGEPGCDGHQLRRDVAEQLPQVARRQLLTELTQDFEERTVRQALAVEVEAGAGQHSHAGSASRIGELGHQPGLAEACVSADEDDLGLTLRCPLQSTLERGKLAGPADQVRTGQRPDHRRRS